MSDPTWLAEFIAAIRRTMRCELISGPTADRDRAERWSNYPGRPCGDVSVIARPAWRLVSVRAGFRATFRLPTHDLPEASGIHFVRDGREGLWLHGPDFDSDEELDLAAAIMDEGGDEAVGEAILQELDGEESIRGDAWRELLRPRARFWHSRWRSEAGPRGLRSTVEIDMTSQT